MARDRVIVLLDSTRPEWSAGIRRRISRGELAVMSLGNDLAANSLPADVSDRELVLVCRLSSQIAYLRRRLRRANRERRRMRDLAYIDPLTGLPNRRAWVGELAARRTAIDRGKNPDCLVLVDLDHFKQINDDFGHIAGDRILVAAAGALRGALRSSDFVARIGGDEFGLILSDVDRASAEPAIERVRQAIELQCDSKQPIRASAGYVLMASNAQADALLFAADHALRQAKKFGRNRTVAADTPIAPCKT